MTDHTDFGPSEMRLLEIGALQERVRVLEDQLADAGKMIAQQQELIQLLEASQAGADARDDEHLAQIDRLKAQVAELYRLGDRLADALEHDTHGQDERDEWIDYCAKSGLLYEMERKARRARALSELAAADAELLEPIAKGVASDP